MNEIFRVTNLVSRDNGSIRPSILERDYTLQAAYDILAAKYEALVKENEKMKKDIEWYIEARQRW